MSKLPALFQTLTLGPHTLKNRAVMCALTRCRSGYDGIATERHAEYYSLRAADAGLVFTESSSVSLEGNSFPGSANIYNNDQVNGWKKVTKAVHDKKGLIYLEICHGGRCVHPELLGGLQPIGPSPIAITDMKAFTAKGPLDHVVPKEMTKDDIKAAIKLYKDAAVRGKEAGFDGIELHGAYGYLVDQFLRDSANQRKDEYGGSFKNRSRFALEILDEISSVFGSDRVGIKLSPVLTFQSMKDSDPHGLLKYLLGELNNRKISFVEVVEGTVSLPVRDIKTIENPFCKTLKKEFKGRWISNFGYNFESANEYIEKGYTDLVSFGQLMVCNSDLVSKFKSGKPLNDARYIKDMSKFGQYFYSNTDVGYLDLSVYEPNQQ